MVQKNDMSSLNNMPSFYTTLTLATLYVLSGVIQPLIMEIAKQAGLTDNKCQIYMSYYLGTASVCLLARNEDRLSLKTTIKTASVASIDIIAQTLNYTGYMQDLHFLQSYTVLLRYGRPFFQVYCLIDK